MTVEADFETRSDVDLKRRGAFVYFESPRARVLLGSFKIGGTMYRWRYGQPCPPVLAAAIARGDRISAHNAGFEYLCFTWLADHCGWPRPHDDQYRCTAATAAAMSLPRALGNLAEALDLPVKKDKDGMRLIRKFSIPRKPTAAEEKAWQGHLISCGGDVQDAAKQAREDGDTPLMPWPILFTEPEDDPVDFEKFCAYCDDDVLTEAAADARLVPLSDDEQEVWELSERINRRGIRIDTASARGALRMAAQAKTILDADMNRITGGVVKKCSEPAKLVKWVQDQCVALDSAAKAEITDLLAFDDIPLAVRQALETRQEAAKTSVSKLQAMLDRASSDGRVRGSFLYHGASTGRWSNMGVNFANMPRPRRVYDEAKPDTEALFRAFRTGDPDLLPFLYGDDLGRPLNLISDAIRGFIWAAPGHDLVQADYSGIEGAVIAWLSGEAWKVKALHDIAADPSIPDMYRQTAAAIMNTTTDVITKKHPLRQSVGKVSELALGFGGGVSAFYSMSRNYGVKLDALYEPVWAVASEERQAKADKRYLSCLKRDTSQAGVLSREAWVACEIIKHGWREANPAITGSWRALETAMREAVLSPGTITRAAMVDYVVKMGFLWARLPSGRCIAYGSPRLRDQVWAEVKLPDGSWSDAEVMDREAAQIAERKGEVRIQGDTSPKVTALGVDSVTKKWRRFGLYGGLAAENNTQATARDLLVNGMRKAEAAGYPIIAHVYDEIICEVPRGFGDLAEFEKLICELPAWAAGLPLTAGGWRGKRYRKE